MKKENWLVIIAGVLVGVAALVLTKLGNPANMGFCIACFERDIAGAVGLHSAAKVQYVRPEIIGLVLGAFIMSVASKEFKARAGSPPALPKSRVKDGFYSVNRMPDMILRHTSRYRNSGSCCFIHSEFSPLASISLCF